MSASKTVSVDELEGAIVELVEQDITRIRGGTRTAVRKAGKAVEEGITSSTAYSDVSGNYRAGWRTTMEGNTLVGFTATIHNTAAYQLAHLLEFGHGGPMPADKHPHIAPAFDRGVEVLDEELRRVARG